MVYKVSDNIENALRNLPKQLLFTSEKHHTSQCVLHVNQIRALKLTQTGARQRWDISSLPVWRLWGLCCVSCCCHTWWGHTHTRTHTHTPGFSLAGNYQFLAGNIYSKLVNSKCPVIIRDAPIDWPPIIMGRYSLLIVWSVLSIKANQESWIWSIWT